MKIIADILNTLIPGILFTIATYIANNNTFFGIIMYIIAYISLDLYSYIDKKLGYPNNLFIKN